MKYERLNQETMKCETPTGILYVHIWGFDHWKHPELMEIMDEKRSELMGVIIVGTDEKFSSHHGGKWHLVPHEDDIFRSSILLPAEIENELEVATHALHEWLMRHELIPNSELTVYPNRVVN